MARVDSLRRLISIVENAQRGGTISFPVLYHVGSMDSAKKGRGSYEGAGLSVSLHPATWCEIAPLGERLFKLTKDNNQFLDYHDLGDEGYRTMVAWGIAHGYIEDSVVFRVPVYDSESDEWRYMTLLTREEAEYEKAEWDDDGNEPRIEEVHSQIGTAKLRDQCRQIKIDLDPHQLLATIWADAALGLDGVWFADNLDPLNLSAPRGVIFIDRLAEWDIVSTEDWPDEDDLYEGAQLSWGVTRSDMFEESFKNCLRIFPNLDAKLLSFLEAKLQNPLTVRYGKHDRPFTGPLIGFSHCHLRDDAILIYTLRNRSINLICVVNHAQIEGKRARAMSKRLEPYR